MADTDGIVIGFGSAAGGLGDITKQVLPIKDILDGGAGSISGQVVVDATDAPLSRRVRLCTWPAGRLIREKFSDLNGDYEFSHLKKGQAYMVYTDDYTETYDGVIAVKVTAT